MMLCVKSTIMTSRAFWRKGSIAGSALWEIRNAKRHHQWWQGTTRTMFFPSHTGWCILIGLLALFNHWPFSKATSQQTPKVGFLGNAIKEDIHDFSKNSIELIITDLCHLATHRCYNQLHTYNCQVTVHVLVFVIGSTESGPLHNKCFNQITTCLKVSGPLKYYE